MRGILDKGETCSSVSRYRVFLAPGVKAVEIAPAIWGREEALHSLQTWVQPLTERVGNLVGTLKE
jgi:hypothetical protein